MRWTVPNILTIIRLISAPAVLLVFLVLPRPFADWIALVLFVGASVTDWFDGYLARKWGQQTKLGAMLDPIADKAMVIIALAALVGLMGLNPWILLPAAVILFRETFVSGLREFLGDTAGTLKVTKLAKWKTMVQMVAISVLFISGIFEHHAGALSFGMDASTFQGVMDGSLADEIGLRASMYAMDFTGMLGVLLLWVAAALTFVTGLDYFNKARPYLKD
ncbi:CDP-diacylglycerol--glycerol-3-phosphate 3-phosphatidyltransferase [Aliiruegeria sabulilitoris]|uniref:CDP-diacylglycerol--glycerol-3-phosphate 3-phosphatidyltransferase n=1 Tax=Aliiruegeria sabulilitoris TaxID=1510458 RepID=UPI00082BE4B3|nr:CDP-diacylglycerol--glycerol-3-phosphate 3-phosphatidyltransferase [Aliiruegeria sabulilitoris]NDR57267.1 CDP-diacylglycerol--glycerol-3-phosphate 3-phosphatidyltransferase [Pseudoruegeria sp. M32A2M]